MAHTIFICGLTEWEKEIVKEHEGECLFCMYLTCYADKDTRVNFCRKDGEKKLLKELKTDCKDWFLDTS